MYMLLEHWYALVAFIASLLDDTQAAFLAVHQPLACAMSDWFSMIHSAYLSTETNAKLFISFCENRRMSRLTLATVATVLSSANAALFFNAHRCNTVLFKSAANV